MTQEYKITTQNIGLAEEDDCYLEPTDPIQELKAASFMGGLGSRERLAQYNEKTQQEKSSEYFKKRIDASARGIKPGSPAWHAFFSK